MKKFLLIMLICALLVLLCACGSGSSTDSGPSAAGVPAQNGTLTDESAALSVSESKKYVNVDLGFSISIPDNWSEENYKIFVASVSAGDDEHLKYTEVTFIFQSDKENPLLCIYVYPLQYWQNISDGSAPVPTLLGIKSEVAYCYQLPYACPYTDGEKANLYNSMVMTHDELPLRFQIL